MPEAPRVLIQTLGCAKNEADSRAMEERLGRAGISVVGDVDDADIIIVNTCCFIQSATEESIEAVLDALGFAKDAKRDVRVIVAGCMPARYDQDLEASLPEADGFVPCSEEDDIVDVVCNLAGWIPSCNAQALEQAGPLCAYLKISDGCDRWCTFCTIPKIRGRYHSFSFDDILAQARKLVSAGTKEIVLIAQDTGIWGHDLDGGHDLAWLITHLAEALPQTRFRIMYTEPDGITDDLLDAFERVPNLCPYLDIPFQHVSPHILAAMNRAGSFEELVGLAQRIRARIPHMTLRTTLMCGFPGETEEDFEELIRFVRQGLFDYIGIFAYSPEEGTKAAVLPDQVPEDIKQMRAQELRDEADSVSAQLIAERIGTTSSVLVEGIEEDGQRFGRAESQAPEVDGVTFVDAGDVGTIVDVLIEDTLLYDMEGVLQ